MLRRSSMYPITAVLLCGLLLLVAGCTGPTSANHARRDLENSAGAIRPGASSMYRLVSSLIVFESCGRIWRCEEGILRKMSVCALRQPIDSVDCCVTNGH